MARWVVSLLVVERGRILASVLVGSGRMTGVRRASRERDAEALDDAVQKHYDSRLSRNGDGDL